MGTEEIFERLYGNWMVDALIKNMDATFEDFREIHRRYLSALEHLKVHDTDKAQKIQEAITRMTHSDLLFSGILGVKANLDNFVNPVTGNFLAADYSDILRENIAQRLPEHFEGQELLYQLLHQSDIENEKISSSIIEYTFYIETVGPKIAHYIGYILGNELLYRTVPGYYPDNELTIRYTAMVQKFLEHKLDFFTK